VLFVVGVATGSPPPETAAVPQVLIVVFGALMLTSLPALYLRQREAAGLLGLVGTALISVSVLLLIGFNYLLAFFAPALAGVAPEILEAFPDGPWQQLVAVNLAARVGLGTGLLLFGIASYQAAIFPSRWPGWGGGSGRASTRRTATLRPWGTVASPHDADRGIPIGDRDEPTVTSSQEDGRSARMPTADRIHRAVSADGTVIAGRVHGQGPPLVLFHGATHDGDLAWNELVPRLADRFTCYLPSWRGQGLSDDSEDHSPPRYSQDATAFVDAIGGLVLVAGWSAGVDAALAAAVDCRAVAAVALFEPTVLRVIREDDLADLGAALEQVGAAVADGRLADAARAFHRFVANDVELAALDADYYERSGAAFPSVLRAVEAAEGYVGPEPTDPEALVRIDVPVLLLRGQQTRRTAFYTDSERYIADHVSDPRVRGLPGLGHFAPNLAPEPVAEALIPFFASVRRQA
jgi:pimeloyl-ACP methyl ester carboxylesterase